MATLTVNPPASSGAPLSATLPRWLGELWIRERRLTTFAAILLALLLPMALAWFLDDRTLRSANVWIKPMKFALSIAVLALTTAWFAGHLPTGRDTGRAMRRIAWLLIATGTFELAYIALQAALGQASHYNRDDGLHAAMYSLMGMAALALTATQPMLAWQLYRHPDPAQPAAYRQAMLIGLVLTFVFGASAGGLLAGLQPPETGARLPLLGWSLGGGDLRPAHFMGIHAEQVLPLIGFACAALGVPRATRVVWSSTAAYSVLFIVLVVWGLVGR